tara:strand:- start:274 stop:1668 length:1395 start_codon:yes stop_codon:yes gene_type:complete
MPLILGTNSIKDTGFDVANSLRFETTSDDYLSKTFGSGGNRRTATQSFWIKRSLLSTNMMAGLTTTASGSYYGIQIMTDDVFDIYLYYNIGASAWQGRLKTNRVFRDVSSWYHIVLAWDTTQSTSSDRFKLYVNGVQETSFQVETYPNQNQDLDFNNNIAHEIMRGGGGRFSGYLAEFVFIDGQALDPTSFGEFDSDSPNIWKPKDVSGLTFGNNGFYLDFENSGSLGADVSGNGNNFTVNNLTSVDQSTDTCTNNFATMNPIDFAGSAPTLSNGNLTVATASSDRPIRATMGFSKGKWYAEYRFEASDNDNHIGCHSLEHSLSTTYLGGNLHSWGLVTSSGAKRNNASSTSYGSAIGYSNSIVMIAIDKDNGKIWWGKDGAWFASGDPANGTNEAFSNINTVVGADGFVTFADVTYRNGSWNFGSPSFAISSGNTDGNGYGNFEYAVPSGYYALNTKNLAEFG